jgi:hypothetical protein
MTYAVPTQMPKDASMNLAIQVLAAMDGRAPHPLSPCAPPEEPLEELIEMRYQQYLAERELWELFENGALQALET